MFDQVKILVIDDEEIMRDGCRRILARDGWTVMSAENGEQGLKDIRAQAEEIDVILLDLMMPGMSGMELLDRIQEIDPNLLVIVITGYATVELAVQAMKKGAYDFTPKPFTPDQLRLAVRRALEKRVLQREADFLRREREKSLRDVTTEKSKLKTIINCMGDGVIVCDSDGCIVLTNQAASRLLQAPEIQLVGTSINECRLHPELLQSIDTSLKRDDAAYVSISQELDIGGNDGVYLRAHTATVHPDTNEILGSVTVLQDISHLKELDKMKSDFIAMVAHELRAPIATIEQQLNVIIDRMAGEITDLQAQLLGRARERTRGVLTLIKDLLDLSKIESGKMVQYKEPIYLHEVIAGVVDMMAPEAEEKRISIELTSRAQDLQITADRRSVEEVFTNLVSNGIKYTPEQGNISISLDEMDGFAKVCVSDTGIGIKKADLDHIFDKFYRVKSMETRQIIGTGLGLSIVKSIVDAHFGSINVESKEGRGTTFTVLFPKGMAGGGYP